MNEKKEALLNPQNSERQMINEQYKDTDFETALKEDIQSNITKLEAKKNIFPVQSLPEPLLSFTKELRDVYSVPSEFPACAALGAVSAALRKKIRLNNGKYTNYPQLWIMLVAPPGIGKTEPLNLAFKPLAEIDKSSYQNYTESLSHWKTELAEARKDKTEEPDKPIYKQVLIDDFTPESLYQTMYNNSDSITLFRDELSGWFADFGRYNKSGEIQRYLSMFNNGQFTINRKSQETLLIHKPLLNVIGSIQPNVLNTALNNQNLIDNGFASRFLFAYPQNIKKPHYSDKTVDENITKDFYTLINHLHSLPEIEEPVYLSDVAKELFIIFSNKLTDKANENSSELLKGMYSKTDIQLLRIALLLHIVKSVYNDELWSNNLILEDTMQQAIDICEYFITCSLSLLGETGINKISTAEAIKIIDKNSGIKNKQAFADSLGVTRQYISKVCNE